MVTTTLNRAHWRQIRAAPKIDRMIVGVDLGQSMDPTAICVLRHRVEPLDKWTANETAKTWRQDRIERFDCPWIQRLPLGLAYTTQAQDVANLLARPPLSAGCTLLLDETGVGRAVADIFDQAGLRPHRVTITAGLETTQHGARSWHVPKGVLISAVSARLHTGELRFAADLGDSAALREELQDFRRKVSEAGRATYAARTGAHDDLVLAVAIALWWATSGPTSSSEPLPF